MLQCCVLCNRRYAKGGLDFKKLQEMEAKLAKIHEDIADVDARHYQLEVMGVKCAETAAAVAKAKPPAETVEVARTSTPAADAAGLTH
jgi:hypothetical protein